MCSTYHAYFPFGPHGSLRLWKKLNCQNVHKGLLLPPSIEAVDIQTQVVGSATQTDHRHSMATASATIETGLNIDLSIGKISAVTDQSERGEVPVAEI